jgi:hypothetical protein
MSISKKTVAVTTLSICCHYAECCFSCIYCYIEYCYAECSYAGCRGATQSISLHWITIGLQRLNRQAIQPLTIGSNKLENTLTKN